MSAQRQTATPSQTFSLNPCRRFLRHLPVVLHRAIPLSAASAGLRHTRHCLIEQFTHSIDVKAARLNPQHAKAILDVMVRDALDKTGENFLRLILGWVFHTLNSRDAGPNVAACISATVSLLRISAVSGRSSTGGYAFSVSVQSSRPPSACQRAECRNRELVPHGRVIHARYRSRQRRSQEMSVRALRRVAHQDGLARLKTLYAACVR